MTEILDLPRQDVVIAATSAYIQRAQELYGRKFQPIKVLFDLKGQSAGMFRVREYECCIRYNPWIFSRYFEENLSATVPHEVAHYIVHRLHHERRSRPHGREWQAVMARFGADPSVTCNFDMQDIPQRRERRFSYNCDCRTHQITTRRHYAVLRGNSRYECKYCRGVLVPAEELSYQEPPSGP